MVTKNYVWIKVTSLCILMTPSCSGDAVSGPDALTSEGSRWAPWRTATTQGEEPTQRTDTAMRRCQGTAQIHTWHVRHEVLGQGLAVWLSFFQWPFWLDLSRDLLFAIGWPSRETAICECIAKEPSPPLDYFSANFFTKRTPQRSQLSHEAQANIVSVYSNSRVRMEQMQPII